LSFVVDLFVFGADFAKTQPMLLVSSVLGGCGLWRDLVVLGQHVDCHGQVYDVASSAIQPVPLRPHASHCCVVSGLSV